MSDDLTIRKIFPRNLTARADHFVRGNPMTTRPESGVDNCYPGLEFDQRNLDKQFFPGLEFEFHGAFPFLRSVDDEKAGRALPIGTDDVGQSPNETIALWSVLGTFGTMSGPEHRVERLDALPGLLSWRVIHDLEPGPLAVLIGRRTPEGGIALDGAALAQAEAALHNGTDFVERDASDGLIGAVLQGNRAAYLEDGVINPALFEAGDLSRSLCAPWQYDFTDCGCFYWASNKPDLVALEPDGPQLYNFQRAVRDGAERPADQVLKDRVGLLTYRGEAGWSTSEDHPGRILNYQELLNDWEVLTPVFDGAETPKYTPPKTIKLPAGDVLTRDEIKRRLRYLATVEHGLMVEYLYAHYSINAPRQRPSDGNDVLRFDVSRSVLSIAIDEMRHFRWANEILRELGEMPVLGRVDTFEDIDNDGRFIEHNFQLRPLDTQQLDWFIKIEKPSSAVDPDKGSGTIDGLYTRILLSIRQSEEFTKNERQKLEHLIKLIIDEGFDHFTRFTTIKSRIENLSGPLLRDDFPENPKPLPDGDLGKLAELVADRAYGAVLSTLRLVFRAANVSTGDFLQASRFAMFALDDAAHQVMVFGGAPLFTLPDPDAAGMVPMAEAVPLDLAAAVQAQVVAPMREVLDQLRASGAAELAESMTGNYNRLVEEVRRLQ